MLKIFPPAGLRGLPCSVVAVEEAYRRSSEEQRLMGVDEFRPLLESFRSGLRDDGYASLNDMNRLVRSVLRVKRLGRFRRGERPTLSELSDRIKAEGFANGCRSVVCAYGHYLYADFKADEYWSFYDNGNDEVVAEWVLG